MENKDVLLETKNSMKEAIEAGNIEKFVDLTSEICKNSEDKVMDLYRELKNEKDVTILAQRGIYQLTSAEKEFYNSWVKAAKDGVDNIPVAIPENTILRVFDDLTVGHDLLKHINITFTKNIVNNIVVNTGITGAAAWGELCAEITAEIGSGFAAKTVTLNKLSAWMPLCLTILELGYEWLDRYVRECLKEALALAFEDAALNGDGANKPIGLNKVVAAAGAVQTTPAADKEAVAITSLDVATLGTIAQALTNDNKRDVQGMVMVVSPADYYSKVLPAMLMVNASGQYVNYLPFPVDVVKSIKQATGKATFFLDKGYELFAGFGTNGGKITHSDEYKFLEDQRVYKIKMVAGGLPKDNAIAYVADISGLQPAALPVKTVTAA